MYFGKVYFSNVFFLQINYSKYPCLLVKDKSVWKRPPYSGTSVMAFAQTPEPLQCKTVFNRYLSNNRSNQKIQKTKCIFFEFCFWEDPLHPVIWSPTHSTSPQTLFFTDISVTVAQIQKIKKKVHLFSNFASGRTLSTQSNGPQPIQLVPKTVFYKKISIGNSNKKKFKKRRVKY